MSVDLSEKMASICVSVRRDLYISRKLFRGKVSYVVQDPVTFQHYRMSPQEYSVLMGIRNDQPLGQVLGSLQADGHLRDQDGENFYRFVIALHQMNFLKLPLADDGALYERYVAKKKARFKQKLFGILFLQIPVINPDALLERTIRYVKPLFTKWAFLVWAGVMLAAGTTLFRHASALAEPVSGLLSPANLGWLWVALFGLKVVHEFGHAYACKLFGGHVPEMGLFFIVFTPAAYVDATASWNFDSKWQRILVSLAGMYVESFVAAIALFVWVSTPPGFVHAMAYNTFFLAGLMTVLFNANPLMRYDGYYVMSDLVEIPNLRQRATDYVGHWVKAWSLGIPGPTDEASRSEKIVLAVYGVGASLYRIVVVFGITFMIAYKFFVIGIVLAIFSATMMIGKKLLNILNYLWFAEETAPMRPRAIAVSAIVFAGVPLGLSALPVRTGSSVAAVVQPERTTVLRAPEGGILMDLAVVAGDRVVASQTLGQLVSPALRSELDHLSATKRVAELRHAALEFPEPAKAQAVAEQIRMLDRRLRHQRQRMEEMILAADQSGEILAPVDRRMRGAFVQKGTPLFTIASGAREIRLYLTEEELEYTNPQIGEEVEFRSSVSLDVCLTGIVKTVQPAGTKIVDLPQLTHLGGGEVAIKPSGPQGMGPLQTTQPYFEVTVALTSREAEQLPYGSRGFVKFGTDYAPLGIAFYRTAIRFFRSFAQS